MLSRTSTVVAQEQQQQQQVRHCVVATQFGRHVGDPPARDARAFSELSLTSLWVALRILETIFSLPSRAHIFEMFAAALTLTSASVSFRRASNTVARLPFVISLPSEAAMSGSCVAMTTALSMPCPRRHHYRENL